MRIRDFIGGRWIAEERGAHDPENEDVPVSKPMPPATAALEQFIPENDALALKLWSKSLPCRS